MVGRVDVEVYTLSGLDRGMEVFGFELRVLALFLVRSAG